LFCEAFWDVSSSLSRFPNAIKKCDLSAAESLSIDRPSAGIYTEHDMKIEAIECFLVAILELLLLFSWCLPLRCLFVRDAEIKAQISGKI
jgi:hypothetical protein